MTADPDTLLMAASKSLLALLVVLTLTSFHLHPFCLSFSAYSTTCWQS
jgi:hypothetical protein